MSVDSKKANELDHFLKQKDDSDKAEMVLESARQSDRTDIPNSNNSNVLQTRTKDRRRPSQPQTEGIVILEFDKCSVNFGVVLDNKSSSKSSGRSKVTLGSAQISKILPNSPAFADNRLKVGDRILEVNGRDLMKASLERSR